MPRDSFYWETTKWAWDLGSGSNANGAKVIRIRNYQGAETEQFRHTGGYLVGCRPGGLENLEADPRGGWRGAAVPSMRSPTERDDFAEAVSINRYALPLARGIIRVEDN